MNKKYDFLIDTHCHLDFDDYVLDIDAVVKNALNAPEPPSKELTKYIWAED